MHFTVHLDGSESPAQILRAADALRCMAGEKPSSASNLEIKVGVDTTEALKELQKLRDVVIPESFPTGTPDNTALFEKPVDEDAPPQDDPAAILAAAQVGGAPLDAPAAAPSDAGAPTSTSAPEGAAGTSTELDSSGLPWDERIHAGSRAKVKDGTWRKRSKLADGVYETIEAELRIHYPKPAPTPPPPPSGPAGGGSEFAALVQRLHAGFARDTDPVTKDQQVAAMQHFGLTGLEDLSKRPDLFQPFADMLGI